MEQKGGQLDRETFCCSICLDLLKDPVTIPCGHSYCWTCIQAHWNGEDQKGLHSCPQCRKSFRPRPVLEKNIMLAALVDQLKKTSLQAAPADHFYAGPEDVACDFCSGRKLKATKSCLACLASYCEKHLQPHYDSAPFKKHKLMGPYQNLQENICSNHGEVMKMFCYLCSVEEHKGHNTVSAAAERAERQRVLEVRREEIQQGIQEREGEVYSLQQEVKAQNEFADATVENCEKIFTQLFRLIHKRSAHMKQQIRFQQKKDVSYCKDIEEKLEQEITELKRKDAELKKLLNTEDHNQFLHNYPSVSTLGGSPPSSITDIRPLNLFEDVLRTVMALNYKLEDILSDSWTKASLAITDMEVVPSQPGPEPKTRAGFLQYSHEITLDPNTVNQELVLSMWNTKVKKKENGDELPYYDHPDRFTRRSQVLSKEGLTGRCYWEVDWHGDGVGVAVVFKSISRVGFGCECGFGLKEQVTF